ncbi:TPA: hypothetical protein K8107_001131 [Staphylococcus pseudintermedius]|uniref:hypothetical protein n=1 Tax=Staphylococcus pseudintermedius TaxID=283734 RepID=UPI00111D6975|nr:hypothetical protein [Staphylococcus pseudintermedius]EHD5216505.1 hypothetical protein [Staphylococcus pseudintermedius]EIE3756966.1 hypothetical protein [Staphylococcus pseudintermedius]EII2698645.1 hypothetical protein [Staphylococcus pseudintermedius]EJG0088296.1 hypothetical protein [Staphylococcus pseudintermedius]TOZ50904.1 hypothetical protein DJ439_07065 [Staphylococcus pseudintermedius]
MDNKFHIQLDEFNLQAINFIKFDNYDESLDSAKSEDKDPKYEVFIEKNTSSVKIVFLHVTLETAEYNLNAMFKGVFKDINNESIDNKKLSSIALSLMLPFARPIIYQNLLQSNLNAVFLPILDIQRHLESYD